MNGQQRKQQVDEQSHTHKNEKVSDVQPATEESSLTRSQMDQAATLPAHPTSRSIQRKALLQMQKTHGNAYVMRRMMPQLQRSDQSYEESASGEESGQQEMVAGGSAVRVNPGAVEVEGGMVNVNAGMTNVSGVLRASTLIADTVVASSYSPGAGNVM